jgi:hypothetical protein
MPLRRLAGPVRGLGYVWKLSALEGKRGPAAAGGTGVGIADPEGGRHQIIDIINFRTTQQIQRHLVDHQFNAMKFKDLVIRCAFAIQAETIGKARASAS